MEPKITLLDKAIAAVSPEAGLRRLVSKHWLTEFERGDWNREQRGYSGGKSRQASSETQRKQRQRINRIWEARDMEEKFCFVRGVLEKLTQYTCGAITYQSRTGDSDIDQEYQDYFHDWCGRADLTGRFRLSELVQLGFRATVRDGEYGWMIVPDGDEIRLQPIEADRIGGPDRVKAEENNINGILLDEAGRVLGYEIFKRSRMAQYTKEDFDLGMGAGVVPAEMFLHLFRPTRADQYHGDSWLSPLLPHARDIHELFGFEKMAMKFAAAFAGFIRRKDSAPTGSGLDWMTKSGGGSGGPNAFEVQAGMIKRLQEGEEITFPGSTGRPSGNLMQFVEILIREMALGLNMPFGFVYNMALLGGVTARIEVMQAWRTIQQYQHLLVDKVLNKVRDLVIERAIAMGAVTPHPLWRQGAWNFGARLTGDTGNYVQEQMMLLQNGIIPRGKVIEEIDGSSNMEVARTLAREVKELQEVGAEAGVPIELIVPSMMNATQMLAAINMPPPEPPPQPKGYVAKVGEKSAAQLIDVLTAYAEGKLERESAIQSLVYVYGVPRAKAESLVPEARPKVEQTHGSGNSNSGSVTARGAE
jgi:lambda family phage portal protein